MLKKIFIIAMIIFISGCGYSPPEGVELYNKTFELMSQTERTIYKRVSDVWNDQSNYDTLRAAIRERKIRPRESDIPFKEFGSIIKVINEGFVIEENWNDSFKKNAKNNKFSSIDLNWYRDLTGSEPIIEKPETKIKVIQPKEDVKIKDVPNSKFLPLEEYEALVKIVKESNCSSATYILQDKLRSKKQLTHQDKVEIIGEVMYCKSK